MARARLSTRPGFTLVELLVVIGLILVLLGLTLAVSSSGITDSYKTISAADRVSGWMIIAKSKAQREKRPAGVRFLVVNSQIREAQYIEVPDSYAPLPTTTGPARLLIARVPPAGPGLAEQRRLFVADANLTDLTQSVFAGDMLSLPEFGTLHTITAFVPVPAPGLTLANGNVIAPANVVEVVVRVPQLLPAVPPTPGPGPTPTYATTTFGFHRKAQPAIGEPTLQLTGDMVVDLSPGLSPIAAVGGEFDVLFAANGEVMNAPSGKTLFWIRDVRLPTPRPVQGATFPGQPGYLDNRTEYEAAGQMALVVVYSKTGAIATQPVSLPLANGVANHNPFSAATDAVNTGL